MIQWFKTRSGREQILVGAMLALACVFGAYQFVFSPINTAHTSATARAFKANADLKSISQSAFKLGTGAAVGDRPAFDRGQLLKVSADYGLSISRVQPQSNAQIQVWFDAVKAQDLFRLIAALETEYAAKIVRLKVDRQQGGRVSAQLTVSS